MGVHGPASPALLKRPPTPNKATHSLLPQVWAATAVSLGSLVVGFASSYTAPALDSMARPHSRLHPTHEQSSWIGSLLPLLALVGGVLGGPLIDLAGRRRAILATAFPFIISFLLIGLAEDAGTVMAGRAVGGLGVGVASLALPVYLGEAIEPRVRGVLGLLPTTVGNIGVLASYTAGMYLEWDQLALLGAILPLPFLAAMFSIPETPRWLFTKGNAKKGRRALRWLRGREAAIAEAETEAAAAAAANEEKSQNGALSSLLAAMIAPRNARPLTTALALMFFQQFSGINAVIFYSTNIFHEAGSSVSPHVASMVLGAVNVGATLAATALVERLGRRGLLCTSAGAMAATLALLGAYFRARSALGHFGWLPLAALVLYIVAFSAGFGPIPWLMMGEILPARVRGPGASLVTAFNWACSFAVTKTFGDLNRSLGTGGTFLIFSGSCALALLFVATRVPETRGRSLEDIERHYEGSTKEKLPPSVSDII